MTFMKPLTATLTLLLLASCVPMTPAPTAVPVTNRELGTEQVQALEEAGVDGGSRTTGNPAGQPLLTTAVPGAKELEYVEVETDISDPYGQRSLAAYFLDPGRWRLVGMKQLTPTRRRFRFMHILTGADRQIPELDPLLIERKPLTGAPRRNTDRVRAHRLRSR